MKFLDEVRKPAGKNTNDRASLITGGCLVLGLLLGTFAKYLDFRQANLPFPLDWLDRTLDFHNFLGGFAPWILIAFCIAVFSKTPLSAAVNVFCFLVGMVSAYYLYCGFVAGFFPRDYAKIWFILAFLSPLFAYLCWYARGKGWLSWILSALILGFLINAAFSYGLWYIALRSWLNLFLLLIAAGVLYRRGKDMGVVIGLAFLFAIIFRILRFGL